MKELPFIVGSQYYRAPTPVKQDWDRDLALFASKGLNTIKIWAQWRWNNPAEGVYQFDDVLELLDLAGKHGLSVVVNTIFDVAPAWVFRKWPECPMVTVTGRVLGPQTLGHRQIGGTPGPCLHHTPSMEVAQQFLAECAKALRDAPALLLWDAWNEPELTCAVAREPKIDNLVCYCDHSIAKFGDWLRARYGEDVAALNHAWGRNYQNWEEVEAPASFGTFRDLLDWRLFFVDTITEELRTRVRILKEHDPTHAVMAHTVPFPIFNLVTCASDDFELAATCDLFGNSAGSSAQAADLLSSAAAGKVVFNAEVHAMGGSTWYQNKPLADSEMDRFLLAPLAQNMKGYLFWQYRPERLGLESPNWGLTDLSGNTTPWLERLAKVNGELQRRKDFLLRARPRRAEVGLLLDPENELFNWSISQSMDFYASAVRGEYDALHRAGFQVRFVHPTTLSEAGDLPVIYAPCPYWLQQRTLDGLKEYVAQGGLLVAEPYFGGMDPATGLHEEVVPGLGWDTIFDTVQGLVLQPSTASFDAYANWAGDSSQAGDRLTVRLGDRTFATPAFHQMVELKPISSLAAGQFGNGWTGLTFAQYEKGQAALVGTYLSAAAARGLPGAADLIAALCERGPNKLRPRSQGGTVRVDPLTDGQYYMVIAASLAGGPTEDFLRLNMIPGRLLVDIMTGQEFPLRAEGDWSVALVPFETGQVRALEVV